MIQILAPDVIDRIAAGEVLDRPANLIKELIENSLDAGASQIDLEFAEGGRQVTLTDNGQGMSREDLNLALCRHATSKIRSSDDLFQLHSFGFRGEALASIAAVSRMSLSSRPAGQETGYRIHSEFGKVSEAQPVSLGQGCEVRVTELFQNVPARLKFLKSEAAESGQIKTTLKALAMANEKVGFSVRHKGQLLFHWPKGQTFQERCLSVLEVETLFLGEHQLGGFRAEVLVSSPQTVQNVNRNMWFFVQRRWIQDRSLTASVMEAYRNLLMHGEYPTAIVRLTLPTEEVDVNVHPTKAQVKFREPQTAFRVTHRAVRDVLEKSPWLSGEVSTCSSPVPPPQPFRAEPPPSMSFRGHEFERTQYSGKVFPLAEVRASVANYQSPEPKGSNPDSAVSPAVSSTSEQNFSDREGTFRWAHLQVIGQLNHTYIVAQTQEAFYLVDQHAAHERVAFEKLMESFQAGKMDVQQLLIPLVLDLSAEEVEVLITRQKEIERLGLSLEQLGPESLALQAIPALVNEGAVTAALQKLAFELTHTQGELAFEKSVANILASMACHSVVRAGQPLSVEEMKSLLVQMDHYPLSSFCPHGRPVFVKRRMSEVEREFGRLV